VTHGQGGQDRARFLRMASLPDVEALHGTFVTHRYPPHVHDSWTIAVVDRGAATFDLEGRDHVAAAGNVFFVPPRAVHTGQPATRDGYSYRVLYVRPELIELADGALAARAAIRQRPPTVLRHHGLARVLHGLHRTLELRHSSLEQGEGLAMLDSALRSVLCMPAEATLSVRHPAVVRARDYINANWQSDFTLVDLAAASGLSPFRLARLFRLQVGAAPSAYRRALRVMHAQRLLRRGESIASVASDCGFYDQSHLNRHFKRVTGVTPRTYAAAA
jgi:AraC-like DNA-binding protein